MEMPASAAPSPAHRPGPGAARALLRLCWKLVSFPVLALLIILEPVVRVLLAGAALLLTLMAFFWKLAAPPPLHVPFFGMLGVAVGCMALLAAYYFLLRLLSA